MADEDTTPAHPLSPPSDLTFSFVVETYAGETTRTFKLLKDTVCRQSVWFLRKVAENASIDRVTDDSSLPEDTIARMLSYLYHGDYSLTSRYQCTPPLDEGSGNEAQNAPLGMSEEEAIRAGKSTLTNVLLLHVRMCIAAAHFGIPDLYVLSEAKLTAALALCPEFRFKNSLDIVDVVEEIYQAESNYKVDDTSLRQHLVDALARDLKELPNDVRHITYFMGDDDLSCAFVCDVVDELVDLLFEAGNSIRMLTARLRDVQRRSSSSSARSAADRVEGRETMRGEND